jgi:hypothetical protein
MKEQSRLAEEFQFKIKEHKLDNENPFNFSVISFINTELAPLIRRMVFMRKFLNDLANECLDTPLPEFEKSSSKSQD